MARFRATIQGQRSQASRLGSANSGIHARINGWDSGVAVSGWRSQQHPDRDFFHIEVTGGSNGARRVFFVGDVNHNGDFIPSDELRERIIREYRESLPAGVAMNLHIPPGACKHGYDPTVCSVCR